MQNNTKIEISAPCTSPYAKDIINTSLNWCNFFFGDYVHFTGTLVAKFIIPIPPLIRWHFESGVHVHENSILA
jgi:hypothetical protein